MTTIYIIKHEELDGDLRRWEVDDGIAFLSKEKALEYIKGKDKFVDEIELDDEQDFERK